jgi:alpha-tubulin suppressor-like RCC1 family protein
MKKIITLLVIVVSINSNLLQAQKIACGNEHSLVVCKDSTVWAWGSNEYGQLGNGTLDSSAVPVQVQGLSGVVAVFAGGFSSFALKANGELWGWGSNNYYELFMGRFHPVYKTQPVIISINNTKFIVTQSDIAGINSSGFSYAITEDSSLWAAGYNSGSLFGNNSLVIKDTSEKDTLFSDYLSIGGGKETKLALRGDGTVWVWGDNSVGSLGLGAMAGNSNFARKIPNFDNVVYLSSGGNSTSSIAIKSGGTLWAWGSNVGGQIGDSTQNSIFEPKQIFGVNKPLKAIISNRATSYAIDKDSAIWAWGSNFYGQLGLGITDARLTYPHKINHSKKFVDIVAHGPHTLALASDGSLWAWGINSSGQLGIGTLTNANTPQLVAGLCEIAVSVPPLYASPNHYRIYPNPSSDLVQVEFLEQSPSKVQILDLHGKVLLEESIQPNQARIQLSTHSLASGIYFIRTISPIGNTVHKLEVRR